MKWKYVQLDKFCDSVRDGTHDTPKKTDSGYKLITAKHINNDGIDFSEAYLISENDYNHINERSKVEKWDVLMSMIGNGLGKSFIVSEEPDYAIKNLALFKTGNEYKAKWLHYFLSSSFGQGIIYSKLQGTGQPFISLSFLRKMKIIIPSSEKEMIKIASILSTYDTLIENNTKRIRLLEQMAENLYKEWFVRFRFPGHENVEMERGVPKGWSIAKLKEIVERLPFNRTYKEFELEQEGNVIVIDQSTKEYLGFHNNEPSHIATLEAPIIIFGDHSCKFQLMIKNFSLGENVIPFVSNDEERTNRYYLFYATHKLIETEEYKRHWGRLMAMKVIIPNIKLQQEFSKIIKIMEKDKEYLQRQIALLTKQRDLLLPRLMSGKLEVTV